MVCSKCGVEVLDEELHAKWHRDQVRQIRRASKPACKRCKGTGRQPGLHNQCGRCGGSGKEA